MKYNIRKIKEKFLRFNCFLVCTINGGQWSGIFKTVLTSVRQRADKQWAIYRAGQRIKHFKMCTWVTNNIWQFLLQLPPHPTPHQVHSCHYHVYLFKRMSIHIHSKEIISMKQDEKSQMQAMDAFHLYIKDNPLGNLTAFQLQNV